jgi:hypothetical protein
MGVPRFNGVWIQKTNRGIEETVEMGLLAPEKGVAM